MPMQPSPSSERTQQRRRGLNRRGTIYRAPTVANAARNGRRVDYSKCVMEGDEKLHTEEPPDRESVGSVAGGLDGNGPDAAADRGASPPAGDMRAGAAKSKETPQLNKWLAFWQGVLHVDTAKMQPWIGLRNAVGVTAPLAVGIAMGMPLGG